MNFKFTLMEGYPKYYLKPIHRLRPLTRSICSFVKMDSTNISWSECGTKVPSLLFSIIESYNTNTISIPK